MVLAGIVKREIRVRSGREIWGFLLRFSRKLFSTHPSLEGVIQHPACPREISADLLNRLLQSTSVLRR